MKTAIRCLILLLITGCALAFSWGFSPETLLHRHGAAKVPAAGETATDRRGEVVRILEEKLLKLGFKEHKTGYLVMPIVALPKVCAVLNCRPEDFHVVRNDPPGLSPWFGDYGAPGAYHLHRRHFYCRIWTFDNKEPSADSVIQVAVSLGYNRYPDYPE